jgi:hypothetical protein
MTNVQLYLSIGMPTLAVLVGILVNMMMFNAMGRRIDDLGHRVTGLSGSLGSRIDSIETRLNQVIGYLMEHRS